MALAVLVLAWLMMLFLDIWTHHNDDATVPEIKKLSYTEARSALERAGLGIAISDSIYDTTVPPGTVMESWPKAGSQVKAGRDVYVTVTAFSPKHVTLTMPITGVSARQAASYLNALGITGVRIVHVPSEYPDLVESASADGRPLGVGSVIPVSASVVLKVGEYQAPEEPEDSISAEDEVMHDLELSVGGTSSYEEE